MVQNPPKDLKFDLPNSLGELKLIMVYLIVSPHLTKRVLCSGNLPKASFFIFLHHIGGIFKKI
jgi:hypothetical protein